MVGERSAIERTQVTFHELDEAVVDWYLASGEWRGRAGGYAIQGRGGVLVARSTATTSTWSGCRWEGLRSSAADLQPFLLKGPERNSR